MQSSSGKARRKGRRQRQNDSADLGDAEMVEQGNSGRVHSHSTNTPSTTLGDRPESGPIDSLFGVYSGVATVSTGSGGGGVPERESPPYHRDGGDIFVDSEDSLSQAFLNPAWSTFQRSQLQRSQNRDRGSLARSYSSRPDSPRFSYRHSPRPLPSSPHTWYGNCEENGDEDAPLPARFTGGGVSLSSGTGAGGGEDMTNTTTGGGWSSSYAGGGYGGEDTEEGEGRPLRYSWTTAADPAVTSSKRAEGGDGGFSRTSSRHSLRSTSTMKPGSSTRGKGFFGRFGRRRRHRSTSSAENVTVVEDEDEGGRPIAVESETEMEEMSSRRRSRLTGSLRKRKQEGLSSSAKGKRAQEVTVTDDGEGASSPLSPLQPLHTVQVSDSFSPPNMSVSSVTDSKEHSGNYINGELLDVSEQVQYDLSRPLPVPFVMDVMENVIKVTKLTHESVFVLPLIVLLWFFAEFHPTMVERNFYVTEGLRQRYLHTEVSTPATQIDQFRQEEVLSLPRWMPVDYFFDDITSAEGFRDFFANVVIEKTFDASREELRAAHLVPFMMAGAMRVRTIRMANHSGRLQESLYRENVDGFPRDVWAPGMKRENEQTSEAEFCAHVVHPFDPLRRLVEYHPPEAGNLYCMNTYGLYGQYHCGGYQFQVPFQSTHDEAVQFLAAFDNVSCGFIDNWATRLVVVEFYSYVPGLDSWVSVRFRGEVPASGTYVTNAALRPFRVYTSDMKGELVYSSFVLGYVVVGFIHFVVNLIRYICRGEFKTYVSTMFHWFDLAFFSTVFITFGYYYRWVHMSLRVGDVLQLPLEQPEYPVMLDAILKLYGDWQNCCVFTIVFLVTRLLKFAYFFAPFRLLLETKNTAIGLLMMTITLYAVVFVGYGLAGYAIFGSHCEAFSTPGDAFVTLMRVFLGTVDFKPMQRVHLQLAFLFFWSYFALVMFFAMAMVTAVLSYALGQSARRNAVIYDVAWARRRLTSLRVHLQWQHFRHFLGVLLGTRNEEVMLREVLDCLQRHLDRLRAENLAEWESRLSRLADEVADAQRLQRSFALSRADTASSFSDVRRRRTGGKASMTADTFSFLPTALATMVSGERSGMSTQLPQQSQTFSLLQPFGTAGGNASIVSGVYSQDPGTDEDATRQHLRDRLRAYAVSVSNATFSSYLSRQYLTYDDLLECLPDDLVRRLGGEPFFSLLWSDLAMVLEEERRQPEGRVLRGFEERVQDMTRALVATDLGIIENLDETLSELESQTESMLVSVKQRAAVTQAALRAASP